MRSATQNSTCRTCPPRGVACDAGIVTVFSNTWFLGDRIPENEEEIHECFNDQCCIVTPFVATSNTSRGKKMAGDHQFLVCDKSRGYLGPLCGGCDRDNVQNEGRFTRSGNGCAQCWKWHETTFALIGLIGAVVAFVAYFVWLYDFAIPAGEYYGTVQKICLSYMQMLGALGIFKARGTDVFNEVMSRPAEIIGGSFTALLPVKCAMNSQMYGPFLLTMAMPPVLLLLSCMLMIPKLWYEQRQLKMKLRGGVPKFKGRFQLPRALVPCRALRLPMTRNDAVEYTKRFRPSFRIAGVAVFLLFSLYPSLVAKLASIFNCTESIHGKRYLVADLTVVCYEGIHIVFIAFAVVGVVIYALGIPVAVFQATAFRSPLRIVHKSSNARRVCTLCVRRAPSSYLVIGYRARYAFLFNGYATNRSAVVVGWEALVMIRKLTVTLAGSTIKDPYLQILIALLILVVSFGLTAFVQPYENLALNILDVLGLFALIITQIASIVYFYTQEANRPFMDPQALEVAVTSLLFALNGTMALVFISAYVYEYADLHALYTRKRKFKVKVETNASTVMIALEQRGQKSEGGTVMHWWAHPSGFGIKEPPIAVCDQRGKPTGSWVWRNAFAGTAISDIIPELIVRVAPDSCALAPGDEYRWMDRITGRLTERELQLHDKGGASCCGNGREPDTLLDATKPAASEFNLELGVRARASSICAIDLALLEGVDSSEKNSDAPPLTTRASMFGGANEARKSTFSGTNPLTTDALSSSASADAAFAANVFTPLHTPRATPIPLLAMRTNPMTGTASTIGTEGWYYAETSEAVGALHGPCATEQMHAWLDSGHLSIEHPFRWGRNGDVQTLAAALGREAEPQYFYNDVDDASVAHGPFSVGELRRWVAQGHFQLDYIVREGRRGETIPLAELFGDDVPSCEPPRWFYEGATDAEVHGPVTLSQLSNWLMEGHFEESDLVMQGRDGDPIALFLALQSDSSAHVGGSSTAWWEHAALKVGDAWRHPTRGVGHIVAINAADDGRVHVEFASDGTTHRYKESSWSKFCTLDAKVVPKRADGASLHELFASAMGDDELAAKPRRSSVAPHMLRRLSRRTDSIFGRRPSTPASPPSRLSTVMQETDM
jgi:hypothetical protein